MSNIQKVCTSRVMPSMPDPAFEQRVGAVRRFSRFYTREIGLLQASWLDSSYSLTQARVLYELSRRKACTASDLASELGLDHGYLSRILRGFADRGLITRQRSKDDGRQSVISLTAKGRKAFAPLDARSQREAGALIAKLGAEDQSRVVDAMAAIEALIGRKENEARTYLLRPHRAGDMGWVVERHGVLYGAEYGWDSRIEGLTAEIVATFLKNFDPARERCWIAEIGGEPVGSVFLVKESDEVARLRLLIVDPKARGLGIGRRLVDECIAFARQAGYSKITLWTHGVLKAARAIYQQAGFTLAEEWVHDEFGKPEPAESWELKL
jgi:DNA-binding MarR family transcriptional regulator/N-acetylglutamate synthase-like GNAT family acetyltransferase